MVKNRKKSIFSIKGPVTTIFLGEPEKNTLDKIFGHFGPLLVILAHFWDFGTSKALPVMGHGGDIV